MTMVVTIMVTDSIHTVITCIMRVVIIDRGWCLLLLLLLLLW